MGVSFEFFGTSGDANADELRDRLRRLEALIDRAPIPIAIAHDAACSIISANGALAELLGVPADANISLTPPPGQAPLYRILRDGQDVPADELPMQYAMKHRVTVRNDLEVLRADGSVRYIQDAVEPLYDSQKNPIGCI